MENPKKYKAKVSTLNLNKNNPRTIRNDKFEKLIQSLKEFPEMLETRPLIINQKNEVIGGNMRLSAVRELGWKTVPVIKVDWTPDKEREFLIKDNSTYGEWDYDILANDFNADMLIDWGVDVWPTPDFKPLTDPGTDISETSEDLKNTETDLRVIGAVCPKCAHEFEINRP